MKGLMSKNLQNLTVGDTLVVIGIVTAASLAVFGAGIVMTLIPGKIRKKRNAKETEQKELPRSGKFEWGSDQSREDLRKCGPLIFLERRPITNEERDQSPCPVRC